MNVHYETIVKKVAIVPPAELLVQVCPTISDKYARYTLASRVGAHYLSDKDFALWHMEHDRLLVAEDRPLKRMLQASIESREAINICGGFFAVALYYAFEMKYPGDAHKARLTLDFNPGLDPIEQARRYMEKSELARMMLESVDGRKPPVGAWAKQAHADKVLLGAKIKKQGSKAGNTVVSGSRKISALPKPSIIPGLLEDVS